jgi:hypothetical protein
MKNHIRLQTACDKLRQGASSNSADETPHSLLHGRTQPFNSATRIGLHPNSASPSGVRERELRPIYC